MGEDAQAARGGVIRTLVGDARALRAARHRHLKGTASSAGFGSMTALLADDAFAVLLLWRARQSAIRYRLPVMNTLLRRVQTVLFGVEIDRRATLGEGVWIVHPVGTVIGGSSRLGDRVKLMGSNTIGTKRDDGYPDLGHDVVVGVGARILGPVKIGDGARIGAGAVVFRDVPAGALAVGVPARIVPSETSIRATRSSNHAES